MSNQNKPQPPKPLMKQQSLPPDINREEAWLRMKKKHPSARLHRSKSCVTNDDIEELRGCFDLGFGFEPDSLDFNPSLSKTIPALDLYSAIHRQYSNHLSRTWSSTSERDVNSSTTTIVNKGTNFFTFLCLFDFTLVLTMNFWKDDDGKTMKKKLKQWAKVVACSARQSSGKPNWWKW